MWTVDLTVENKAVVLNCFPSTRETNFPGLQSVFEKLLGDGLVWMVALTVEIKAAFSNFSGELWRDLIQSTKAV